MLEPMTLKDTRNATSSLESADGALPCASRDGTTIDLFGQEAAPASPLAKQVSRRVNRMKDISGRYGSGSSPSADLQRFLESRLQMLLPTDGGIMLPQIWKKKITPAGRLYCELITLESSIKETGCFLYPTIPAQTQQGGFRLYGGTGAMKKWRIIGQMPMLPAHSVIFAAWLMGYPAEWLKTCFVELATLLCHKSQQSLSKQSSNQIEGGKSNV